LLSRADELPGHLCGRGKSPDSYNLLFILNSVFTRVINHCVALLGVTPLGPSGQDRGASGGSRLVPTPQVKRERRRVKKTTLRQYLKAIRAALPSADLRRGIRFC
jgi:hypothetical protein